MGFPVQAGSPIDIINNHTYTVGAFQMDSIVGVMQFIGIFEKVQDGWNSIISPVTTTNQGDLIALVQQKGGINPFIQDTVRLVNQAFAAQNIHAVFAVPHTAFPEPATDSDAIALCAEAINTGTFQGASSE